MPLFFSRYVHGTFLLFLRKSLLAPFGSVPKKARYAATNGLTLISNDAFFRAHTLTHTYARSSQDRTVI